MLHPAVFEYRVKSLAFAEVLPRYEPLEREVLQVSCREENVRPRITRRATGQGVVASTFGGRNGGEAGDPA